MWLNTRITGIDFDYCNSTTLQKNFKSESSWVHVHPLAPACGAGAHGDDWPWIVGAVEGVDVELTGVVDKTLGHFDRVKVAQLEISQQNSDIANRAF